MKDIFYGGSRKNEKSNKESISCIFSSCNGITLLAVPATSMKDVSAATSKKVYFYPSNGVVTYKPGDQYSSYYTIISIIGCSKKSEIKKLKSTNKDIRVEAKDGYVKAYFGKKAATTTISCTAKGVKIKTKLTVKKYTNPVKTFKIGSKNYASKYAKNDDYRLNKKVSKKQLSIKANAGWKIRSVYVVNGSTRKSYTWLDKTSFSKKITLSKVNNAYVYVVMYNTKTGAGETLYYYYSNRTY